MPRQIVTLEVVLSVDADKADALIGTQGWSDPSGDCEPPITGLVLRADQLVWSLANLAMDQWRDSLDAYVVQANGLPGEIEDDESEF